MGVRKALDSKRDLQVTQGHFFWCHSVDRVRFPSSLPLQLCLYDIVQDIVSYFRDVVILNTSTLGVVDGECSSTRHINPHTKFEVPSFTHSKDDWAPKFNKKVQLSQRHGATRYII